ncbi:MAG TPA: F0F1 ATP synthase subunit delta [Gammaproteobacteria bacterium]|nr:F0F1 ATP synthase subunit delta [Gammaproteobacteria bacterium]
MELSWSTFLFEMINFLVLVWILKRFLYQPVLNVIARRRSEIEEQLAESRRLQAEAGQLKADYENRLDDWGKERQRLRDGLATDLDAERAQQLEALQSDLAAEREKARVAEARRQADAARETEQQALQQGAHFAASLLGEAAGPELEARLADILLDELEKISDDRAGAIRKQWGEPPAAIRVESAFPLDGDRRRRLEKKLKGLLDLDLPVNFEQKPELLAGLQVTVGAWVMQVNLRDELKGFAELSHASG